MVWLSCYCKSHVSRLEAAASVSLSFQKIPSTTWAELYHCKGYEILIRFILSAVNTFFYYSVYHFSFFYRRYQTFHFPSSAQWTLRFSIFIISVLLSTRHQRFSTLSAPDYQVKINCGFLILFSTSYKTKSASHGSLATGTVCWTFCCVFETLRTTTPKTSHRWCIMKHWDESRQ